MAETLTWVYAAVTDLEPVLLEGLTGVGGEQVRLIGEAGLGVVAGSVDAAAFSEDALERSLAQPGDLELIARAHHHVIATLAAACPALPFRLATVYLGDDAVRALLAERREEFTTTLRWLGGHTECGVKVWADPGSLAAEEPPPADAGPAGAGASYLRRRRADLAAAEDGWQRAATLGDEIHAELGVLAVATRRHATQDTPLDEGAAPMVLNGAYLIGHGQVESFAAAAEAVASAHGVASLEVTGPWPPYSFAAGPQQ